MLQYQVIKKQDADPELLQFWRTCVGAIDPSGSPLLSPEYCDQLDAVCNDVEIGVVKNNHTHVGLLPFHRRKNFIGRPLADHVTDAHAFLTLENNFDAADWIGEFKLARFDFDHLLGPIDARFVFEIDPCYRIDLSRGFEDYLFEAGNRSKLIRQAERKQRGLIRDFGSTRFEWRTDPEETLGLLVDWKTDDLQRKGFQVPFTDWVCRLMENLAASDAIQCHGLLSGLYAGNEVAALHFGIASPTCLVSWMPCVNPKFDKYSPGSILYLELAKTAAQLGIQTIDLGRGENQTKVRLANDCTSMAIGSVCTSSFKLRALRGLFAGKRMLRSLKRSFFPR